jgi:peptide/nickel transport system substrate-binding protein
MDNLTRREVLAKAGAAATLVALPATLTACGSGGGPSTTKAAGGRGTDAPIRSLTWALKQPVPTLDVATGYSTSGVVVMSLGLEGLVAIDNEQRVVPRLAESWSQPDPLRYVYKLRSGVKFWDGTPLTVDDVLYSMSRHIDPEGGSQIATAYQHVKSIRATGPAEVTVELSEPDPLFQFVPARSYITPKRFSERLGKELGVAGDQVNTMGTGPYRITKFDTDTGATLVRNAQYWGKPGSVESVTFKIISDPNEMALALESGDIKGTADVSLESVRDLSRDREIGLDFPSPLTVYFLSFDVTRAPWSDIHIRRAVAHAANTAGFVKTFLGDAGTPARALPAPGHWSGLASRDQVDEMYRRVPQYAFDLEQAKKELAQSRHPTGFTATIEYSSNEKLYGKVLVSLSESLRQIGINLRVKEVTPSKWLANLFAHNQPIFPSIFGPSAPDPTDYLNAAYLSANARKNGLNTANFKDERVDRLLREQERSTDKKQRASLMGEVLRIGGEQLPYLPLWWQARPLALDRKYVYDGYTQLYYFQNWLANVKMRA